MKKHVFTVSVVLVFAVGLSILLYPAVSDYVNSLSQTRVISKYQDGAARLSGDDCREILEAARAFNEKLRLTNNRFSVYNELIQEDDMRGYLSAFDFTHTGNIGAIKIDAIDVNLPIYLGTDEGVLQIGAGLFEGSSLPVGGAGTHSIISGHTGLPSSTLFTNLDRLVIGDTFTLTVLKNTLTYKVDDIKVVKPEEVNHLAIDPGEDYCTLLTCTPYGVNSHRLLVRGRRVFPEAAAEATQANSRDLTFEAAVAALMLLAAALAIYKTARKIRYRLLAAQ